MSDSDLTYSEGDEFVDYFAELSRGARITVEGEIEENVLDDFENGRSATQFFLRDDEGRRRSLAVNRDELKLRGGTRAVITGSVEAGALTVESVDQISDATSAAEIAAAATMRKAVVLRVNFSDKAVSCSDSAIAATMFNGAKNVSEWYRETSNGLVAFEPDTNADGAPDVFSITIGRSSSTTCDYNAIASEASAAATAAGVVMSNYQHKIYVLPNLSSCGWAGLGNVGCSSSCSAWINTCQYPDVYAHELGHNLGFAHASTDANNDGTIDSEYGDYSDFMGIGGVGYRHNNSPHKAQMNWLPSSKIASISSSVSIAPVEQNPSATTLPQAVRVAKANSPGSYYYLSYRRALGNYSTNLGTYADTVEVHRYSSGYSNTLLIAKLATGATWSDAASGLTVMHAAHDTASATINFNVECVRKAPAIVFASGAATLAGGQASISLTVSNLDSACPDSTFALASVLPSGWSGSLSQSAVTLAPGAQAIVQLSATAGSVADGIYSISVSAVDASIAAHNGAASTAWKIDSTPPAAVTSLSASSSRSKVQLTWTVPSDGAGSGVATYEVLRDGVKIATSASTSWVDSGLTAGVTYSYSVVAIDRVGNRSGPGNAAVVVVRKRR